MIEKGANIPQMSEIMFMLIAYSFGALPRVSINLFLNIYVEPNKNLIKKSVWKKCQDCD